MSRTVTVVLPYPAKTLSPNARPDKFTLARAKKAYRKCGWEAGLVSGLHLLGQGRVTMQLIFCPPPVKRKRDLDNAAASMKSGLDGIADALKIDDSEWEWERPMWGEPTKTGEVQLLIQHTPSAATANQEAS